VSLYLHALGHFHPENEITNSFLEDLDIGTTDAWIMERVGIRSRRTTLPLDYIRTTRNRDPRAAQEATMHTHADTGRRAAEMALARAGIRATDVGLVIAGSSAMDTATPAEACNVARALGIEATAFDVNSACTSFFVQLHVLSLMRPDALPPFVLLVVPEAVTRAVDYTDRAAAVLWGDGRVVQMFAIKKTAQLLGELQRSHRQEGRRLHFVGHQANGRMLDAVCRQCGVPEAHHHSNVEWYGNTAGAGAASVLSMRWDDWTANDDVAVVGVGAGLTWASYLLRFEGSA